jgi:hypothetical protein
MIHNGNILESAWCLRGFEQRLKDLVLNPELAQVILALVADFMIRHFICMLEVADGRVDSSNCLTSTISCARPTKRVHCAGRLTVP